MLLIRCRYTVKSMAETLQHGGVLLGSAKGGKLWCALVSFALATSSGVTSPTANAAETKIPAEWILVQNEDASGLNTVYVTHDAVKIINTHLGCHMVVKAPDWKVHCFQLKEKIEWIGPLDQFSGEIMLNPYLTPRRPAAVPLRVVGTGTLKGLRYKKYPVRNNALLLVATDISITPQAGDFISRFYGLPYVPELPLYSCTLLQGQKLNASKQNPWMDLQVANDLRSGLRVNLETQSCKKVAYNAADFEIPRNFKHTADLVSVTLSGDKKSQFSDMLDNVGFTTQVGKKNQSNEIRKPN